MPIIPVAFGQCSVILRMSFSVCFIESKRRFQEVQQNVEVGILVIGKWVGQVVFPFKILLKEISNYSYINSHGFKI